MAVFHGKDGSAKFDGSDLWYITDWSIDLRLDTRLATPIGTENGNNQYVTSFTDWFARVRAFLPDNGERASIGDTGTLTIYTGGAVTKPRYSGDAICVGVRSAGRINGMVTVVYQFLGNGTLSET